MPNYPYHTALNQGRLVRAAYKAALRRIARVRPRAAGNVVPIDVYTFCGEGGLPEQVASLRSFLRNVGVPGRFTIVSDGTLTPASGAMLRGMHPCVAVTTLAEHVSPNLPAELQQYVSSHAMGKKLAVIMSMPAADGRRPSLYTDSDILFFPAAARIAEVLASSDAPAFYLPDCVMAGDDRLIRHASERSNPVNAGFVLLRRQIDWGIAVERFTAMTGDPIFFTDQTMVHLAMHANGAAPLDPRQYVLQVDDQFRYRDHYAGPSIAMRHYVGTIRHKFWNTVLEN